MKVSVVLIFVLCFAITLQKRHRIKSHFQQNETTSGEPTTQIDNTTIIDNGNMTTDSQPPSTTTDQQPPSTTTEEPCNTTSTTTDQPQNCTGNPPPFPGMPPMPFPPRHDTNNYYKPPKNETKPGPIIPTEPIEQTGNTTETNGTTGSTTETTETTGSTTETTEIGNTTDTTA